MEGMDGEYLDQMSSKEREILDWAYSANYGESKEFEGKTYTVCKGGPPITPKEIAMKTLDLLMKHLNLNSDNSRSPVSAPTSPDESSPRPAAEPSA